MGYDSYKRCNICYKILDLNDAFSGSKDYCPFCMMLLNRERKSKIHKKIILKSTTVETEEES